MIACKTTIAVGVEGVENTAGGHGYNIKILNLNKCVNYMNGHIQNMKYQLM